MRGQVSERFHKHFMVTHGTVTEQTKRDRFRQERRGNFGRKRTTLLFCLLFVLHLSSSAAAEEIEDFEDDISQDPECHQVVIAKSGSEELAKVVCVEKSDASNDDDDDDSQIEKRSPWGSRRSGGRRSSRSRSRWGGSRRRSSTRRGWSSRRTSTRRVGYRRAGYRRTGYRRAGYRRTGYRRAGYRRTGYRRTGYRRIGYRRVGYRRIGYRRIGYRRIGYRRVGYRRIGYRRIGYRRIGYRRIGYRRIGYRRIGYRRIGYRRIGYRRVGYRRIGYRRIGYRRIGYRRIGYRRIGYRRIGYRRIGYRRIGYRRIGYRRIGYRRIGYRRIGYRRIGYRRIGFRRIFTRRIRFPTRRTNYLKVSKGQITFDSEGNNKKTSKYFSRKPHVPSRWSGVTLGRGYDMKHKSQKQVIKDLTKAGVSKTLATKFSKGAGLSGKKATDFLKKNHLQGVTITGQQQKSLFKISYGRQEAEAKRLVNKYYKTNWSSTNSKIQQVLTDMKYRGDLLPRSNKAGQKALKKAVEANSVAEVKKVISNRNYWKNVPKDRFQRRVDFLKKKTTG
eukprot:gene7222-8030_t